MLMGKTETADTQPEETLSTDESLSKAVQQSNGTPKFCPLTDNLTTSHRCEVAMLT